MIRPFKDHHYVTHLGRRIGCTDHWELLNILMDVPFVVKHHMDYNRVEYSRELRMEAETLGILTEDMAVGTPIMCLELLITIAKHVEFQCGSLRDDDTGLLEGTFWLMLDNIGLTKFTDSYFKKHSEAESHVYGRLTNWINREFKPNGDGGLFKIDDWQRFGDQREVEIWYQMCHFIVENGHREVREMAIGRWRKHEKTGK